MKVLLVNPPWYRLFGGNFPDMPIGLCYLAAVLKDECEVFVYNADFDKNGCCAVSASELTEAHGQYKRILGDLGHPIWAEVAKTISQVSPDVLGITIMTPKYDSALNVARLAKEQNPDLAIVAGGIHSTICPHETARNDCFDFVVKGEGELALRELIHCLSNGTEPKSIPGIARKSGASIIDNPCRENIQKLDSLPVPARELIVGKEDLPPNAFGKVMASRGCPHECVFCSSRKMWGRKVRYRSPENVVAEMEQTANQFGTRVFDFEDDNFTTNKKWVGELCDLLMEGLHFDWSCNGRVDTSDEDLIKRMKRAGCTAINFGVESGSQKVLDVSRKGITLDQVRQAVRAAKRHGLQVKTFFMMGLPGETKDSIVESVRFLKEIDPDFVVFSVAVPFPGSDLYTMARQENSVSGELTWSDYYAQSRHMGVSTEIGREEFVDVLKWAERAVDRHNGRKVLLQVLKNPGLLRSVPSFSGFVSLAQKGLRTVRRAF